MDVREKLIELLDRFVYDEWYGNDDIAEKLIAHGVMPVVRCKDCIHSYDDLCGLCCTCGPYVDCIVQPEFYCADGKRRGNDNGEEK